MNQRKYFGTDGIRGRVGEWPISADFVLRLGRALGVVLGRNRKKTSGRPLVLIGKDTRASGYMFDLRWKPASPRRARTFVCSAPCPRRRWLTSPAACARMQAS